jgi:hypothetical protein
MDSVIYIPIGCQCLTPNILKDTNTRFESFPFDWILCNPKFVYEMLYLLLVTQLDIEDIVRNHFFLNDKRASYKRIEHYVTSEFGFAICNTKYNVIFPHDTYDESNIQKYIRRFHKLKEHIFNKRFITLVYISQSSLTSGNFTIDGNDSIYDVYFYMNKIYDMIYSVNKNTQMIVFDSIQNESINYINKSIKLYLIDPKPSWVQLKPEILYIIKITKCICNVIGLLN